MRGQDGYDFGMSAGASVRKGKTAKQVKSARKKLNAAAEKKKKVNFTKVGNTPSAKDSKGRAAASAHAAKSSRARRQVGNPRGGY